MTFFVVDVETTGIDPLDLYDSFLATVGCVAVHEDSLIGGSWYARLDYPNQWDPETKQWWLEQNTKAKAEMFSTKDRLGYRTAAERFTKFVNDTTQGTAFFAASPVTFDYAWVQRWFRNAGLPLPFHYRTLDLRSALWSFQSGVFGEPRRGHQPRIPHHALHDAQAAALDLVDLLM